MLQLTKLVITFKPCSELPESDAIATATIEVKQMNLSVAQELQADFYAGFGHITIKEYLEEGDIDEALSAANAVGDDAIQKRTQGQVAPDSFTHGTSEQRKKWFMKGYKTGDIRQGDTFSEILN